MSRPRGRSGYIAEVVMLSAGGAGSGAPAGPGAPRPRMRPGCTLLSASPSPPPLQPRSSPPSSSSCSSLPQPYLRPFSILPSTRHMVLPVRPRAGNHVTCPFVCRGELHSGPFVAQRKWPICRQLETPRTSFYPQETLTLSGGRRGSRRWGGGWGGGI